MVDTNYSKLKDELNTNGITIVDFYANWCGPCQLMQKELEKINDENVAKIVKLNIDIDENKLALKNLNASGIPTLVFYKDNEIKNIHSGYIPFLELKKMVNLIK